MTEARQAFTLAQHLGVTQFQGFQNKGQGRMPKDQYCWRCKMTIPMLSDQEWEDLQSLANKEVRQTQRLAALCHAYETLTGFHESNPNAIFHHVLSLYGSPCTACNKPLRTKSARFCAACGHPSASNQVGA